jgi:hypothetical protein
LPCRAIDTPLGLFTDVLSAVLALDLPLDDVVTSRPAIGLRNCEQCNGDQYEANDLVQERAIRPHNGTVVKCLLDSVVGHSLAATPEHGELLVEVAVDKGEQRNQREDYVRDEGVGDGRE